MTVSKRSGKRFVSGHAFRRAAVDLQKAAFSR